MIDGSGTGREGSSQIAGNPPILSALRTSVSHQLLSLFGATFFCFELVFLTLYFDKSWFFVDLLFFGIPAIFLSMFVAHFLLLFSESKRACRWFSFIFKGKPPVAYRQWLQMNEEGISFGLKQVRFAAIDELELTWLGNLVLKSRLVCGSGAQFADKVLKVPFSAAASPEQKIFLATVRRHKPDLVLNKRLAAIYESRNGELNKSAGGSFKSLLQKGSQATQLLTAAIMAVLLLDLGYSSFYYLEMLKNYYLAETDLLDSRPADAVGHLSRAEKLRLNPIPVSWVSCKFLKGSTVAAGIWEERSRVLWLQGKHAESIENGRRSIQEAPSNLRHRLYLARLFVADNKCADAREQLRKILDDHKHSFMPRLYMLAISKERDDAGLLNSEYKTELDECYQDTYEGEPRWPPGGDCFFTELFYSDDVRFLLDRFLGCKYQPPSTIGVKDAG